MHLDNVAKEMNNINSLADIIKSLELFKQLLKEIQDKVSEILASIAGIFRKFWMKMILMLLMIYLILLFLE